jgi:manganese oxidase
MRVAHAMPLAAMLFAVSPLARRAAPDAIAAPNDNRVGAGTLADGVLTIGLEAKLARWYPDGDSLPGAVVASFAEIGKAPTIPGPLIRVPKGTVIAATVLNSLADTLAFHIPAAIQGAASGVPTDSIVIAPGERRELRISASANGNFIYRALHRDVTSGRFAISGQLTGAIVVDSLPQSRPDRVMVITLIGDSISAGGTPLGRPLFAINGRSWPHTERISATVGDTVRWRVLNASQDIHPMHLHGFYFRVDRFRMASSTPDRDIDGRMAVTQAMPPFSTLSMSWVPERAGNWLFHCHFQLHLLKADVLPVPPAGPVAQQGHAADHSNHALTGMSGLVMGIHVSPRPGSKPTVLDATRRRLRLLVVHDAGLPDTVPSMRFVIEENGKRTEERAGFSPTLNLLKGQPVSITVVNQLAEATAVHWHGMELESYFDGVAGLSGEPKRLAPMIAPRDSFEARFTPPRAGTFMYHSHVDEPRTHRAGLLGAMIVRERSLTPPVDEHTFFIKATRTPGFGVPIDINGEFNPDTVVVRAGRTTRLRVLALTVVNPGVWVQVTSRRDSLPVLQRDSLAVPLRVVAKDGAELRKVRSGSSRFGR